MIEETPDIELLPCPECGETPWLYSEASRFSPGGRRYTVICDCGYSYGCTSRSLTQQAYNIHRARVIEELAQARQDAEALKRKEEEKKRVREERKAAKETQERQAEEERLSEEARIAEEARKAEEERIAAEKAKWLSVKPEPCTMPIAPEEPYLYPVPLAIYIAGAEPAAPGSQAVIATHTVLSAAQFCLFATDYIPTEGAKFQYVWQKFDKMNGYVLKLTELLISTDKLPQSPYIASLGEDKRNSTANLLMAANYLYKANQTPENALYLFSGLAYRIFLDLAITRAVAPDWFGRKGFVSTWQNFFKTSGALARKYDGLEAYRTIEQTFTALVKSGRFKEYRHKTTSAASKRKKTHNGKGK